MKKLDIYNISEQLMEKTDEWETKSIEMAKTEIEYQNTSDSILMSDSGMGFSTQVLRDAYVRKVIQTDHEQLFVKYHTLLLELRLLSSRIKTLTTISANLRNIGFKGGEY